MPYQLIFGLACHAVARQLRTTQGQRPIDGELASIYARLRLDDLDISPFSPLTTLVINKAEDAKI